MADYHVGLGVAGIYAGTLNKAKTLWRNKSDVTDEAIETVAEYIIRAGDLRPGGKESATLTWTRPKEGTRVRLTCTITAEDPEITGDPEEPQEPEKRAHWVEMYPYTDTRGNRRRDFACSACHCKCAPLEDQEPPTVCPVCQAIMEGIEE